MRDGNNGNVSTALNRAIVRLSRRTIAKIRANRVNNWRFWAAQCSSSPSFCCKACRLRGVTVSVSSGETTSASTATLSVSSKTAGLTRGVAIEAVVEEAVAEEEVTEAIGKSDAVGNAGFKVRSCSRKDSSATYSNTLASRDAPIVLSVRACSKTLFTSVRTWRMACHC